MEGHICLQEHTLKAIENKIDVLTSSQNSFKIEVITAINEVKLSQVSIAAFYKVQSEVAELKTQMAVLTEQLNTAKKQAASPWKLLSVVVPWAGAVFMFVWSTVWQK